MRLSRRERLMMNTGDASAAELASGYRFMPSPVEFGITTKPD
jgi:hypothetical protein